jgi:hypothetical protein
MLDGGIAWQVSTEIQCGAGRTGRRHAVDEGDLVGVDPLVAHDDAGRRTPPTPDQPDRRGGVDPQRSVQGSGGAPGDDVVATRPQPGADDPGAQ